MAKIYANFKVTLPKYNRTFVGSVTDTNGKLSISGLNGAYGISPAQRYQAKAIITKEWPTRNPEIFSYIEESNDDLVETLRKHTQDLYAAFIEKTNETARRMFSYYQKIVDTPKAELEAKYGIKRKEGGYPWEYADNSSRIASVKLNRERDKAIDVVFKGYEDFLAKEIKHAEAHYEASLFKLADRLTAKGISGDFTITSGRVGVNFEVTIKHGDTTTRAWTIIAEGEIQRAHYRYLVK